MKHRIFNIILAAVYIASIYVVFFDVLKWRR